MYGEYTGMHTVVGLGLKHCLHIAVYNEYTHQSPEHTHI